MTNKIVILNCILTILLIFLLYILSLYNVNTDNTCSGYKIYKKMLYSDIIKYVKSGDLLFFDNELIDIHIRAFGHLQFSHIGIIVEIDDVFYVFDINDCDEYINNQLVVRNGVNLTPLYNRIHNYNGDVYLSSLKNKLSNIQIEKFNKTIIKYYDAKYMSYTKIFTTFLFNNKNKYKNELHCIDLISAVLDEIDITQELSNTPKRSLFKNIINLSVDDNCDIYLHPVQIIIDNLIIDKLNNDNYKYIQII